MATTARRWTALSNEELGRLLSLLKGADSVELKLTVPDGHQRSAVTALGMGTRSGRSSARCSSSTRPS
jgi:hypothetical protein